MLEKRVIPFLTINRGRLVKTIQFKKENYIGDPINAVRIFNDKAVDEIVLLDIGAQKKNLGIDYDLVKRISSEAFIPLSYGGGVRTVDDFDRLFQDGVDKVIVNSLSHLNPEVVEKAVAKYGSQSIVGSVDVRRDFFGARRVFVVGGAKRVSGKVEDYIDNLVKLGVGEIVLGCIDKDGMMNGLDVELINRVSRLTNLPLIAVGGAGKVDDVYHAMASGADGVGLGSLCVYKGKHKGILINYPDIK